MRNLENLLMILIWISITIKIAIGKSFHYKSFKGPVSGVAQAITVSGNPKDSFQTGTKNAIDYVSKPDYQFEFGVDDPHTGNLQKHQESRDGDVVKGQYSFVEADGFLRVVTYVADAEKGFRAYVERIPPKYNVNQQKPNYNNNKRPVYYDDSPAYYDGQKGQQPVNYDYYTYNDYY